MVRLQIRANLRRLNGIMAMCLVVVRRWVIRVLMILRFCIMMNIVGFLVSLIVEDVLRTCLRRLLLMRDGSRLMWFRVILFICCTRLVSLVLRLTRRALSPCVLTMVLRWRAVRRVHLMR